MARFASMFGTNMSSPDTQYSKFPVILVHLLFWAAFLFLPLLFFDNAEDRFRFLRIWGYQIILTCIYFYINYSVLIPKIFFRRKFILYSLSLIFILVMMMVITYFYFIIISHLGWKKHPVTGFEWSMVYIPMFPCVLAFGISTTMRMTSQWISIEQKKKELENEKLSSELGFLRSQINPHFLFNTLNNICSLARKKSDETEPVLIKLSEIMRYMLDDAMLDKVPLSKEVEYLHNYIELQQLRFSGKVDIRFEIKGDTASIMVDPLLLIPFVENAFKHGVSYKDVPLILIRLEVGADSLSLHVENKIYRSAENLVPSDSGIGLKNVKRRLELTYPEKHQMRTEEKDGTYVVDLKIFFL